jgi:glycerophosphoryl diester phosphodiesterase
VRVFGHRGASAHEPENTMRAFVRALDDGADGVELDVRLCATGELVVGHDPTLLRCGGDPRAVGATPWSEIRHVNVGRGERPPLLAEVLDLVHARMAAVNVEVKTNGPRGPEVASAVAELLAGWGPIAPGQLIVSSFDPRALWAVRRRTRGVPTGLLFGSRQGWVLRSGMFAPVVRAAAVHPEKVLVSAERVRAWRRAGRQINVWTVDEPAELRRLRDLGVDSVICNDPAAARATLR